jgi:3-oxoacyl-[acyl-carrier-protein] synthase II
MKTEDVVITGVGVFTSLGQSLEETFKGLLEGRTGIHPIEGFPIEGFTTKTAAQVGDLDPKALGISRRDARIMDTHAYMLVKCARDAFAHAGLDGESAPKDDIAFFAGMGCVDYRVEDLLPAIHASMSNDGLIDYGRFYSEAFREIYPLWPLGMLNNIAFCLATIALGVRGENTVFSPDADSGAQALSEAALSVAEGRAPQALAAGVSEKVSALNLARASLSGILGKDTCRPFSSKRDGTILGEGCAVLALENGLSAKERGVTPLARITGHGEAFSIGDSVPDAKAIARAMHTALEGAGLNPSDMDVLIAHGDGTPAGDRGEAEAVNKVFSGGDRLKVYSSKGALGHMLAASAVVDTALGIQMLRTGAVPPTLNADPLDEALNLDIVTGKAVKMDIRRVMVSCISHEGQCAALIVEAAG